ncbi:MAG: DEAD/DEAH box helicase, partial [Caldilineaceae bacterium]|nr:DEAD/DEAH box helicase [Caldilineaceae bacterium]
ELRPVQVKAIQAILDTPHNVLITSGTASGKTEAAILPILTLLQAIPSTSIGVLYVGPLKALINDQFERVQAMLDQSGIPVQSWHGDVARSPRSRFLRNAQGILQITPESLEAMLMHRNAELARLFGDLRFVIIDEVHAFINSDRGRQVICQLQRLAYYQKTPPRRIGLSATIGEPELAMTWLSGGSASSTLLIDDADGKRSVQLGLEHFVIKDDPPNIKDGSAAEMESSVVQGDDGDSPNSVSTQHVNKDDIDALYLHMYQMCQNAHKSLIFANTRGDTEKIGYALRELALRHHTPDIYHVHHGSLSAALRETAEDAMRDTSRPTAIAATVTLELGIDVGQLDQVLQLESTHSVSSFVQRLGRSGRRGSPSTMFLYSRERVTDSTDPSGHIPWNLLQTIAIIQLYIAEKWVEPPAIPKYPFSLLYHQTMSTLAAATELSPARLAERVLTLPPFVQISQEQYRTFLLHLLELQHLEKMETGALIIGLQGEKVINNYRFYATFEDDSGYKVMAQTREIGSIPSVPPVDTTIGLAGFTWRIVSVDDEHRSIQVQRARGKPQVVWVGGGIDIHDRIVQRVRQVLTEGKNYGYLLPH